MLEDNTYLGNCLLYSVPQGTLSDEPPEPVEYPIVNSKRSKGDLFYEWLGPVLAFLIWAPFAILFLFMFVF